MKKVDLSECLDLVGLWFLPSDEDNLIPGRLTYSVDKGIRLNLESQFDNQECSTIWGVAGGQKVTLLNSFSTSFSPFAKKVGGYFPTEVIANQLLLGQHFQNEEDITVQRILFETSDIKPWTLLSGFTNNIEKDLQKRRFTINYQLPETASIYSDENVDINILTNINIPSSFPPPEEVVFKEINYFEIKNKSNESGLGFCSHIDAIRKFVSLASRQNVKLKTIRLQESDSSEYVHFITNFIDISLDYKGRDNHPYNMFFTFKSVDNLNERYGKWYEFLKSSPEPVNLYFSKSKGYLHDVFLMKAQALEEIHRKLSPDKANFGYKSIVSYLFEKHIKIMSRVGDKEVFSSLVRDHRDYFTHWFEKKKDRVFSGIELDYLSRDVNLLMELCLLEVMGFCQDEIERIIENCFDYRGYLEIGRPDGGNVQPPHRIMWK
ncbi:HEPN domain-containing protein [Vibrio vulnificus]|uniref:ApeA N-terminal domain 1-containing protein n=1 Tax=Vibrio vulnificus TaxID=672 RepID=UPI0010233BED|nr:HEPN domain-containing protein [Vibrio vulnificus]RZP59844.1 hypothetical protein D8T45_19200 [Vibrio vulnificus]RZR07566.1 hypothetical protein D8T24_23070 [Vibrio vulnificus]HDY7535871.1 hypothetical protein [Vibrio vulnificus]